MPTISPAINPQSVLPKRQTTMESAQNFISGGSVLGSSVVSSASNKIVGFQRAAVRPATPDINSIVSTISSNILNQVDNSIKNATNIINKNTDLKIQNSENQIMNVVENITPPQNNQVTQLQTVVERIQNQTTTIVEKISEDYKKRVGEVDSARPNNLLTNFIQLYKTAIDFIKFFGDRRNINTLRDNLVSLRESFSESFEVAKLIRNTIVKIVGQLSSLPSASPGSSSGINLDVNVPGGGLKKTLPPGAKPARMRGGKLGMLGLGLGGIAAGGAAVNALSDSDLLQPASQIPTMPVGMIDTFSFIVNKFASAVEEMISGSKTKKRQTPTTSSPGGGAPTPKPSSSPASPGGGSASDVTADTQEEKAWLQTIRQVEGTADKGGYNKLVGGEVVPELTQMTLQEIYDLGMKGKNLEGTLPQRFGGRKVKFGADSHAMGGYQFKPQTMMGVAKQLGLDPKTTLFSPEIQDKLGLKNLRGTGVDPTKRATKADIEKAGTQWAGLTPYWGQTGRTSTQSLQIWNQFYGKARISPDKGMGGLGVDPSKFAPEELAKLTQDISQPPPTQTPTVTTLPLDMSGGGGSGKQQASGPIPAPIRNGAAGPSVPFLTSSDPENFLVLYSKMVYNIVGA